MATVYTAQPGVISTVRTISHFIRLLYGNNRRMSSIPEQAEAVALACEWLALGEARLQSAQKIFATASR